MGIVTVMAVKSLTRASNCMKNEAIEFLPYEVMFSRQSRQSTCQRKATAGPSTICGKLTNLAIENPQKAVGRNKKRIGEHAIVHLDKDLLSCGL